MAPCYQPLNAWRTRDRNPHSGKYGIAFHGDRNWDPHRPLTLPCGQCIGCRLERSRQWAIRCHHEAKLHNENSFVTLTYNDANLPQDGSLNKRHFQLFMKRLRKKFGPKIRYFHCGEYGEKFFRPHYHACLFNFDFPDKIPYKENHDKTMLYNSPICDELWDHKGYCVIGSVTFQSAAYVARYITKKITGDQAEDHYTKDYTHIDPTTGEIHNVSLQLQPEYTTMSLKPGIGHDYFHKWMGDVYPNDFVIIKGKKMKPPRYYDQQYELTYPSDFQLVRGRRVMNAKKQADENTPERLSVREEVQKYRMQRLKRPIEEPG